MTKTKPTTEITQTNSERTKALDIIRAYKPQVDAMGQQLMQIKVMDENTLAICQQNLSKVNSIIKTIEDKRIELKAPFLEAGKQIDALCKSISEVAAQSILHAKTEVANWEKKRVEETRKIQEEIEAKAKIESDKVAADEARKKEIKDFINLTITPYLQNTYNGLKTPADCNEFLIYIATKFPGVDKFQEFLEDAHIVRDNFIELIKAKKAQISAADNINDAEKELLKEKAELAKFKQELAAKELAIKQREQDAEREKNIKERELLAEQEKLQAQATADLNKTKGIRKLWRFKVVDADKVPREWLQVNEEAVKQFIKEKKDVLTEGYFMNGIEFFTETSVVA